MKLLREAVPVKETGWSHIQKTYPDTNFVHDEKMHPTKREGSWHLDNNLNPHVHLHKDVVNKDYVTKSKEEFYKAYHHPLFGLIPHEKDEASVGLRLMKGEHEQVQKEYPKYKPTKMNKKMFGNITYDQKVRNEFPPTTSLHLKTLATHNPKYFHEMMDRYGGIAHDVITSRDRKTYDHYVFNDPDAN